MCFIYDNISKIHACMISLMCYSNLYTINALLAPAFNVFSSRICIMALNIQKKKKKPTTNYGAHSMHCFHHIHSLFHHWLQNRGSKSNSHSSISKSILPTVGSLCLALLALHGQYVQKADLGYAYKRPGMPILVHLKLKTKAQVFKVLQPLCLWKRLPLTQKYYRDAYCTPLRQKEAQIR